MHIWWRCSLILAGISLLAACSEEPKKQPKEIDWDRLTKAVKDEPAAAPADPAAGIVVAKPVDSQSSGGVTISLRPEQPSDNGCLRAMVKGQPGRGVFQWFVNGEPVPQNVSGTLCSEFFKRDDQVTVHVGTNDAGASTTVTIGNTPPRVTEVTATADQVYSHGDITVSALGDDGDGDPVEFRYQWLINGEPDSFLTDATLPAAGYAEGDTIQFRITPFDGFDEGPPYQSDVLSVGNAPPVITSKPPLQFESQEYSYQVEASDPDDAELAYSLKDPPAGMNISADGLVSWPLTEVEPGEYKVSIVVTDPAGDTSTQEYMLNLSKTVPKPQD